VEMDAIMVLNKSSRRKGAKIAKSKSSKKRR